MIFYKSQVEQNIQIKQIHIKQIVSKLHNNYYVIKRASRLLSTSSLTMLYNSLCLPYMLYFCEIWAELVDIF